MRTYSCDAHAKPKGVVASETCSISGIVSLRALRRWKKECVALAGKQESTRRNEAFVARRSRNGGRYCFAAAIILQSGRRCYRALGRADSTPTGHPRNGHGATNTGRDRNEFHSSEHATPKAKPNKKEKVGTVRRLWYEAQVVTENLPTRKSRQNVYRSILRPR